MKNEKWFEKEVSQIEKQLNTNAATGLTRKAARSRSTRNFGQLFLLPKRSPLGILLTLCSDFSLIMLLFFSLVSLLFGEFRSAMVVLVLLIGNLGTMVLLLYRARQYEDRGAASFYPTARVIREGRLFRVGCNRLVVGDVILVEEGDMICADARLVTSENLEVSMRVDRERWIDRKKVASTHVPPNENRPWEMTNMLHGGSRVLSGSGRAIVTEVGRYTYLGALTGGIELSPSAPSPAPLSHMRRVCSKAGLILLVAVIPFTLISLVASATAGGTVLLSTAFLSALSLVATTSSQLCCSLCSLFYGWTVRRMAQGAHPSAIRSARALDRLSSVDYLFFLDGGALTDGILHYSAALSAEGELKSYPKGSVAAYLSELASLYTTAATRTLTTGLSGLGGYLRGVREFVKQSGVDEGALAIRCSILTYGAGNLSEGYEQVYFTDGGKGYLLQVSGSAQLINRCDHVFLKGEKQTVSEEGRQRLIRSYESIVRDHRVPMIFAVSPKESPTELCFVGMVVLREGWITGAQGHWKALQRTGCRAILFQPADERLPKLPEGGMGGRLVRKEDFLGRNLPVTEVFGRFSCYEGMTEEDIRSLIQLVHKRKQRVWLVGMGDAVASLGEDADGVISYAPVLPVDANYREGEILFTDTPEQGNGASCSYALKDKADLLIPRPSRGRGGLASLASALGRAKVIGGGMALLWQYLFWVQWIRLIVLGLPMLLGQIILDARHVLLLSFIMDGLAAACVFHRMVDRLPLPQLKDNRFSLSLRAFFGDHGRLLTASLCAVSVLLLPEWVGLLGFMGRFLYKTEFFLCALLFLHVTVLFRVCYRGTGARLGALARNRAGLAAIGFCLLFLLLCALWEPFGILFEFEQNPLPYLLLSLIPSLLYLGLDWLFEAKCK